MGGDEEREGEGGECNDWKRDMRRWGGRRGHGRRGRGEWWEEKGKGGERLVHLLFCTSEET